jgi:hypothetical protein
MCVGHDQGAIDGMSERSGGGAEPDHGEAWEAGGDTIPVWLIAR